MILFLGLSWNAVTARMKEYFDVYLEKGKSEWIRIKGEIEWSNSQVKAAKNVSFWIISVLRGGKSLIPSQSGTCKEHK